MADEAAAPVTVSIKYDDKDAQRGIAALVRNQQRELDKLKAAFGATAGTAATSFKKTSDSIGRSAAAANQNVRNLGFQISDVSVQLASGTGVVRAFATQADQLATAILGIGGASAGMTAGISVGVSIFAALAVAAANYFSQTEDGVKKSDDLIQEHAAHIRDIKDAYGDAASGLGEFVKKTDAAMRQQLTQDIKAQEKAVLDLADAFGKVATGAALESFGGTRGVPKAIVDLLGKVQQGKIDVQKFVDEVMRLAAAEPANKQLQAYSDSVQSLSKESGSATDNLRGMKSDLAALDAVLAGIIGNAEKFNEALKAMADIGKIALTDAEALFAAYSNAMLAAQGLEDRRSAIAQYDAGRARLSETATDQELRDYINRRVDNIIQHESGGSATAKNPDSTATGAGQFIESTWLRLFPKIFPGLASGASTRQQLAFRTDPTISRRMTEELAYENLKAMREAGTIIVDGATYLAHFLGEKGAEKVLNAAPDTPISQVVGADKIAANKGVFANIQTAGQLREWAAGIESSTKAKKADKVASDDLYAANEKAIEQRKRENEINRDSTATVNEKAAAIEQAKIEQDLLNAAQADGITVTDALRQKYHDQAVEMANLGLKAAETADKQKQAAKDVAEQVAATQQLAQQMSQLATTAIGGFISDLRAGVSAGEAFNNMLNRIIDSLIQMALQSAFSPGNFMSLLGGGGTGFAGPWGASLAKGGIVGAGGERVPMDPRDFAGARSYARGGFPGMPPGAIPIYAHPGELIIPKSMVGKGGGAGITDNSTVINSGAINIDMSATGLVTANTKDAKQLGMMIKASTQAILVQESRPGGLLRKAPA